MTYIGTSLCIERDTMNNYAGTIEIERTAYAKQKCKAIFTDSEMRSPGWCDLGIFRLFLSTDISHSPFSRLLTYKEGSCLLR